MVPLVLLTVDEVSRYSSFSIVELQLRNFLSVFSKSFSNLHPMGLGLANQSAPPVL